jgi:hypothetical protein
MKPEVLKRYFKQDKRRKAKAGKFSIKSQLNLNKLNKGGTSFCTDTEESLDVENSEIKTGNEK